MSLSDVLLATFVVWAMALAVGSMALLLRWVFQERQWSFLLGVILPFGLFLAGLGAKVAGW